MARWLAEHTWPDGGVVATDINIRHLTGQLNLTVLKHDITIDPLPANTFDLVHARLVLLHLPQRHAVLRRLVKALKPGGILVLDEFDCGYAPVLHLPPGADPAIFPRYSKALNDYLTSAGADPLWGRHALAALTAAGLSDVDVQVHLDVWRAGSPGCELHHSNSLHLRQGLHAHGVTEAGLVALRAQLRTPGFAVASYPVYSVSGRRSTNPTPTL